MARGATKKFTTRPQLAKLLDVDPRTVAKFLEEGLPVAKRGRGGRPSLYDPEACLAWKAARDKANAAEPGPLDPIQERAKKDRFQALLAEQMYLTRKKQLLPAADVLKAWSAEITAVRALVLASYTTHADRIHRAALTDGVVGVERELRGLGDEILRELARPDRPVPGITGGKRPRRSAA